MKVKKFGVVSLFPEVISSACSAGVIGRAIKDELIFLRTINPRDFTHDAHHTVDDKPYGGGAGMVMKAQPLYAAIKKLSPRRSKKRRVILLSASGRPFTQRVVREYAEKYSEIILVCGRYEGVDARVAQLACDEELSVGPFVLSGGEIAACAVIDAVARLVPGVLGNEASLDEESHNEEGVGEYPQYTRPVVFEGLRVPEVLLSGDHKKIVRWRQQHRRS